MGNPWRYVRRDPTAATPATEKRRGGVPRIWVVRILFTGSFPMLTRALRHTSLLVALCALPMDSSFAQQPVASSPPAAVTARASDVESIDAIIAALYDVISGPKGQPRDWHRFRTLMAPSARLIPTGRTAQGEGRLRVWTADEYIAAAGPGLERNGFFEREIGRTMERYGNIVHLMSAYDSKYLPTDAAPFARGINSIQLWYDGTRWWVVTVYWEAESTAGQIPLRYLGQP